MTYDCTGVILAGGVNKRLPGIKKTFREIRGRMIMEVIHSLFTDLFDRVIIVANDPAAFGEWDATIVSDIYPHRCPLAGIHAGLFYASTPRVFVSACDTPFLERRLAEYILSQAGPGIDVVIPETDAGLEPLCATYSKHCLPLIETNLKNHIFKINRFFREKRVRRIPMDKIQAIDPEIDSFFNINTPEDLERARAIAVKKGEFNGYK
ncbi:MobA [Desulforapulum autotrophicum HRM2]|uniref:Probable molybdenum cofactor guanylyltransferase n=1 Tax=Desulforapulum autotrophicum (strain ATCC 43914 / DSM 3382 / VKM B-1955 / HRM2) TaxID=177437 RepID=C0QKG4_DESAH|nr:molybdenum cofactor guanylyltransferase [Desulforapulum autotrophicum]ACN14035.1 MobA [Desulforapulum autotrophicum HRM2]